jgi:hypothetical protein
MRNGKVAGPIDIGAVVIDGALGRTLALASVK